MLPGYSCFPAPDCLLNAVATVLYSISTFYENAEQNIKSRIQENRYSNILKQKGFLQRITNKGDIHGFLY